MINIKFFYLGVRRQETGDRRQPTPNPSLEGKGRGKMWGEIIQKIQHTNTKIFGQN
ncbi:MAG: hypothetical protein F6K48_28285 [Okeania sp. SIO3H1]|nr:hypothetical protein [Okeania sp. SIO3H1]